jgi:hypothetical protein
MVLSSSFSPLAITSVAIATATNPNNINIDKSPSFPNQEIIDPPTDWIYLANRTVTKQGAPSTDIASVDYFSDGQNLNATLWLYFPFKVNQSNPNKEVRYGMLIDADFDLTTGTTGFGGIDYKVQIRWDNQSKKWSTVLEKWSHLGKTRVLSNKTIPYISFSNEGAHYVTLSADLDSMLSPKKYRVIFYGEAIREESYITDFTRWIAVPPVELEVSTSPVELRKGEQKTIEIIVNTTQGYEPKVILNTNSTSDYLTLGFAQNDSLSVSDLILRNGLITKEDLDKVFSTSSVSNVTTLRMPSYGIATTRLTIDSSEDASIGQYTLFIFANSFFPPEEFIRPKPFTENHTADSLPPLSSENIFTQSASENKFTKSALLVTLQEPLTLIDNISDFWNKLGAPISFIYGIIAGVSPWLFTKIKERLSKKEDSNKVEDRNHFKLHQ